MRVGVALAAVVAAAIFLPGVAHAGTTACELAVAKGTVSATGSCDAGWSYRRYDSAGHPCGAAVRGKGTSFRLPAGGIATIRVKFGAVGKTFDLGGTTSCVTPAAAHPPSRSRLCAWAIESLVPAESC